MQTWLHPWNLYMIIYNYVTWNLKIRKWYFTPQKNLSKGNSYSYSKIQLTTFCEFSGVHGPMYSNIIQSHSAVWHYGGCNCDRPSGFETLSSCLCIAYLLGKEPASKILHWIHALPRTPWQCLEQNWRAGQRANNHQSKIPLKFWHSAFHRTWRTCSFGAMFFWCFLVLSSKPILELKDMSKWCAFNDPRPFEQVSLLICRELMELGSLETVAMQPW